MGSKLSTVFLSSIKKHPNRGISISSPSRSIAESERLTNTYVPEKRDRRNNIPSTYVVLTSRPIPSGSCGQGGGGVSPVEASPLLFEAHINSAGYRA
jgi:hypothetical protein